MKREASAQELIDLAAAFGDVMAEDPMGPDDFRPAEELPADREAIANAIIILTAGSVLDVDNGVGALNELAQYREELEERKRGFLTALPDASEGLSEIIASGEGGSLSEEAKANRGAILERLASLARSDVDDGIEELKEAVARDLEGYLTRLQTLIQDVAQDAKTTPSETRASQGAGCAAGWILMFGALACGVLGATLRF